jgi:hemoglobin-like flavoprotein
MTGQIRLAQHAGYIFLVRTVMSPTQVNLVQESFRMIAPQLAEASRLFYDELFRLAPDIHALFPADMNGHKQKFTQMLGMLVKSLDRINLVSEEIISLGHRHMAYDIGEDNYETFGEALLSMLEKLLGPELTPQIRDAWAAAYDMLARVMQEAAELRTSPDFYSRIIRDVMVAQYGVAYGQEIKSGRASISRDIDSGKVVRLS